MLQRQPRINELQAFIAKVMDYPITARQLVTLALAERARPSIIEFYAAFLDDTIFENEEELLDRSEQVAIMDLNLRDQPRELLFAAEED